MQDKPLLFVDIDGVISLFDAGPGALGASATLTPAFPAGPGDPMGNGARETPAGRLAMIDGIAHFLSANAARHLLTLARDFDPVWCSGWEEKANEYLPHLLELPGGWPYLEFSRSPRRTYAHWKLDAIETYAGSRALAWIDDALDEECRSWARERQGTGAPTLLVEIEPARGLLASHVRELRSWAGVSQAPAKPP